MRRASKTLGFLSIAILLFTFGSLVGQTEWSKTHWPLARPDPPSAMPTKVHEEMAPDKALAVAMNALADAKIKLFANYRIQMTRRKHISGWGVWFVALPEAAGMDYYVTVESDGSTTILPGL